MQSVSREAWFVRLCMMLCALLIASCEQEGADATALVLSVKSDLDALAKVEVAVFEGDADPSKDSPDDKQIESVPAKLADLPLSIVVTRGKASEVLLAVRAYDKRGKRLVENRVRARFETGKSLAVHVFLANVCLGTFCEDEPKQTCYVEESDGIDAGQCGQIPLLRASDLEPIKKAGDEGDWTEPMSMNPPGPDDGDDAPDAGMDAGPDGGSNRPNEGGIDGGSAGDAGDAGPVDAGPCAKPPLDAATCGLFPQCGCPTGQSCRLSGANVTACIVPGSGAPTTACVNPNDCQAGYDCIGGRCAAYCQADSDCPGTGSVCLDINNDGAPVSGARACILACNRSAGTPCGTGTACATATNLMVSGRVLNGDFCLKPQTDCGFKNNGKCDEPEGTRLCAEGTDVADCAGGTGGACTGAVKNPPSGTCDLVAQCGCTGTTSACVLTGQTGTTTNVACAAPGSAAREALCNATSDCARGLHCFQGVCRKYCDTAADCGSGSTCDGVSLGGVSVTGVKICFAGCTSSSSCASGAACTNVTSPPQWCVKPVACSGSYLTNGVCDEPEGTRFCTEGTDPVDCGGGSCTPTSPAGGACDLVTQCPCTTGQACTVQGFSATGVPTVMCATAGTTPPGGACSNNTACTRGYICVSSICQRACRPSVASDCDTGTTCQGITIQNGTVTVQGVNSCR